MSELPEHYATGDTGSSSSSSPSTDPWILAEQHQPVPDLSQTHHKELKALTKNGIAAREGDLACYKDLFRELQIIPSTHKIFFEEVILYVRNKNIDLLKRGTDSSLAGLTKKVLTGFGYICWVEGSAWTIEPQALDEGEARLLYDRHDQKDGNQEFYPIFHKLWTCMRSLIFELKAVSGLHTVRRTTAAENLHQVAGSDTPVLPLRQPTTYSSSESTSTFTISDRSHIGFDDNNQLFPTPNTTAMQAISATRPGSTPDETMMTEIQQSLVDFARLYYQSDPAKFRFVWQQHIGPIELLDVMVRVGENQNAAGASRKGKQKQAHIPSLPQSSDLNTIMHDALRVPVPASEPNVATIGYTLPAMYLEPSNTPTNPPNFISLYINKSRVLDYSDIFPITPAPAAFFQPAAPIAITNMTAFLDGIDLRADIPTDHFPFAYVFSYPWNDAMTVIHNDQPGHFVTDAYGVDRPCQEKRKKGWACLQKDIAEAARGGNRVWRLKVLVLYGTLLDDEEGTTAMVV